MKLKVTTLTAAVICLILLALDSFIYLTLRRHIMSLESIVVAAHADTVAQSLYHIDDGDAFLGAIQRQLAANQTQGESILVLDGDTKAPLGHVGELSPGQMLGAFHLNNVTSSKPVPIKIGQGWYMTVLVEVVSPLLSTPAYYILFSQDIHDNEDYLHTLLTALILGSIGAVILAAGGGYAVSAAAARPIDQMIRLVARIQAGKSNERLPLPRGSDEVARLAETFNQMLDRIERSFHQQAQFVADASHEIRTPLTTIQGYAQLLGRWGKQDAVVLEKAIQVILKESARLRTLTNDMLTLADMESARQVLSRTCDVNQTITDVLEPYELLHPDHRIEYTPIDSCFVAMAPEHFGRVLTNLVDNAIKYTPAGGKIEVRVHQSSDNATVTVTDTGQGIPEEDLAHIFDRFYRVDKARSRVAGGNGLGLAIVKELVELYKGTIWATSVLGEGTSVMFSLPVTKPTSA